MIQSAITQMFAVGSVGHPLWPVSAHATKVPFGSTDMLGSGCGGLADVLGRRSSFCRSPAIPSQDRA